MKKRGKDYVGLCPFHSEKTPSFKVDPVKQYFYCFGCKENGSAIDFVMKRDRVEFKEALQILADAAGIDLPRFGKKQNTGERQLLLEAHSAACALFEKWLSDPTTGNAGQEYLKSRGFNAESIKNFQIGLTLESWDGLLRHPTMKRFGPGLLHQAGLIKARDGGTGHYDTFRNRLMFPIRDETGRIIAFGGRVMPGSKDPAKYLNSPETPLFSKSKSVFGLDLARHKIVETRTVAVVEGYTDVVMAHQYGASNVVSILGTAMTEQHVDILKRFADRIVLLFDADTAGDTAVNRAVELFLTKPIEIAIASMAEGVDPDEYLLEHGADGFARMLAGASNALTFKWKQLSREFHETGNLTAQQTAVNQYLDLLANARLAGPVDPIRWGMVLTDVSRLTGLDKNELNRLFRLRAPRQTKRRPDSAEPTSPVAENAVEPESRRQKMADDWAENWILGVLLNAPEHWHDVQQYVHVEDFSNAARRKIAELYWSHQRDEGEPVFNEFLSALNEPGLRDLAIRLVEEAEGIENVAQTLADAIKHLQATRDRQNERKLVAELRRTSQQKPTVEAEIDLIKKLYENARRPDLRRSGS
ncbi:MAG TPA: DNA primase [Tepidisphaeraceae bacterium]|nr:DNA primase [Tepidisphaeraceae bacterium]